jgi:tetratricopeptide (TPR) repeat protein
MSRSGGKVVVAQEVEPLDQASQGREELLARIRHALSRGEYLLAFDLADAAARAASGDILLQYYAVLALARAGATDHASDALASLGPLDKELGEVDPGLAEDLAALAARLAKDRALSVEGAERKASAKEAAALYEAVFARTQRPFSCINAATLWALAGERHRAAGLAETARRLSHTIQSASSTDRYWLAATEAEACLILDDPDGAKDALRRAAAESSDDLAVRAVTRNQLRLLCEIKGFAVSVLAALAVPKVVHYCGHMIDAPGQAGHFPPETEPEVAEGIAKYFEGEHVGFGYGSLASGGDILIAEALSSSGAEVHVFLPFAEAEFRTLSVARGGRSWLGRFERCLERATSVSFATSGDYLGDVVLFDYCARLAMGHALIRSRFLATDAEQLVVWDGRVASESVGGTARDVSIWRATGQSTHVIATRGVGSQHREKGPPGKTPDRIVRAMLFADIRGFSSLEDSRVPRFLDRVMRPLAMTLDSFGDDVLYRNSWGDGLYIVLRDVASAARCALALQETMKKIDLQAADLPEGLGLRVAAHVGPVFEAEDPVRREPNFYGAHVTWTARIEPRTPEGDVYVTDPFAALIALEAHHEFACEYVGHIPTAKDYGVFPMYVLKPLGRRGHLLSR